jgi:hypothetical protein
MKRFFSPWASRMGRRVSAGRDVKGILWDRVTADRQAAEIRQTYPSTSYRPSLSSPQGLFGSVSAK